MSQAKIDFPARPNDGPLSAYEVLEEEFRHLHREAAQDPALLHSAEDPEIVLRRRIHALPPGEKRTALCLSGGGIRSATFSLGVLQGLAQSGWLGGFHYLSTVSGGGYIGSWLSSWIQREGFQNVLNELASVGSGAAQRAEAEPAPIRHLRSYSNYLSPVWGLSIDFVTLIFTFIRNLLLHWAVFIPLLMAALIPPRINVAVLGWNDASVGFLTLCLALGVIAGVFAIGYIVDDLPGPDANRPASNGFVVCCFLRIFGAAVLLSWTWDWAVLSQAAISPDWSLGWYLGGGAALHVTGVVVGFWLRHWRGPSDARPMGSKGFKGNIADCALIVGSGAVGGAILHLGATYLFPADWLKSGSAAEVFAKRELYATFAVPFLMTSFWLGTAVYTGLSRRVATEDDREWWARSGAYWIVASAGWIAAHGAVIYGPRWLLQAAESFDPQAGIAVIGSGGLATGLLTSVIGYFSKNGLGRFAQHAGGILAALGRRSLDIAAALFIGILLLGLNLLVSVSVDAVSTVPGEHLRAQVSIAYTNTLANSSSLLLLVCLVVLAGFGVLVSWIIGANAFSLHGMYGNRLVRAYLGATRLKRRPHLFTGFDPDDNLKMALLANTGRLFHVVNIALNMVKPTGNRLEWQQRKAASFTVSGLHCGNRGLGYQRSSSYSNSISLGRAMTISGAAASPNMGYHTSPLVAFVMAFFNVRLGWWLPNPGLAGRGVWQLSEPSLGVRPLIDEAFARTTDNQPYAYLSDGGHFDNLGLYEMVYRRCHEILVVDAGCDSNFEFEDLENAVRKIRADLGIPIEFPGGPLTPQQARATGRHFVIGRIRYSAMDGPAVDDGRIIYIKPVLSGDEPLDVERYGATHSDPRNPFPHQSTNDQFFDETQFESYRELGYHSVMAQFPPEGIWPDAAQAASGNLSAPPPAPGSTGATEDSGGITSPSSRRT